MMAAMRSAGLVVASSLATLVAATVFGVAPGPALAGPAQAPILGGERTNLGDYPSTLVILVGGGLCTATLLTPEWVLTAAHCISPEVLGASAAQITSSLRVHLGTVNLGVSPGTVLRASAAIPHPDFSLAGLGAHDIGLIKLVTPVTDVTMVPINLIEGRVPPGTALTMVGFGTTVAGANRSGVEYVVQQTSVSCGDDEADANLLCFDQTSGRGKCHGDSGGPSVAMIGGALTQVGVTSFGDENCAEFGADTRIEAEREFLLAHVPALGCAADGACTTGCGFGALPIDPDCPVCDDDAGCPGSRVCFDHRCIAAPFAPTGLGSECTSGTECETGECATRGDAQLCILSCTPGAAGGCPDGFDCAETTGTSGACWPADTGCCCDAGQRGAPTAWLGAMVIGLVLRRRRRPR